MRTKEEILQGEDERTFITSCYFDLEKFGTRVLGLTLKHFHKEWLQILRKYDRIAIAAPTGFGKTTIFGILYPLWMAYFKPKSLSLIVSKTIRTQSANVLEEIKTTIENNEILKQLKPEDYSLSWTKEKLITTNGSKILYSSNTVNVRGIQADYEFDDEVSTFEDHELFWRDVATRVVSKQGKLAAVSTPITEDDLLAEIMANKNYFSKFYPAITNKEGKPDINGESIWPEKFPKAYLLRERENGIANFERNYMCNPKVSIEAENPFYKIPNIEDCFDITLSLTTQTEGGIIYIGCDFAYSDAKTADYDCFIVVEYLGEKIIIRHIERNKGVPMNAKLDRLRELNHIYNPSMFIIDPSNVGTNVLQQLRSEGFPIEEQSFQSQARRKLLIDLKMFIDSKRLRIPRNLDDSITIYYIDILVNELKGFIDTKSKLTKTNQLVSLSSHDDTVMALAMACKGAQVVSSNFEDSIASGN